MSAPGVSMGKPQVVIVGGGFAGLACARALADAPVEITLVDRSNHHLFQPLLYQVATAALNPSDIAAPIRSILRRQKNVTVLLGEVTRIDAAAGRLELADGELRFDALLVATGATHSWFGHDEWAPNAPGLKTLRDALEIRARILRAYEQAERAGEEAAERAWLTFVVVGGGPTGVELAGALAEIGREALERDFRRIVPKLSRVVLVEADARVLSTFPPELSQRARESLERLGVEVRTGAPVTKVDGEGVTLGKDPGERIAARTVLWAAGVTASPLAKTLGAPLDRAGRVKVEPTLAVPGMPNVFVAGDLAAIASEGRPVPGVAPAAMQMGRQVGLNLRRLLVTKEPLLPFRYRDRGNLATIGRARAVADLGWLRCSGLIAWLLWTLVHIFYLVGFRNRFFVMLEWAWLWATRGRGVRLITLEGNEKATSA